MRSGSLFSGGHIVQVSETDPPSSTAASWSATPVQVEETTTTYAAASTHVLVTADQDGDLPIHIAVAKEDYQQVSFLIESMVKDGLTLDVVNGLRQTPLHIAVLIQNIPIVHQLLGAGASPWICDRHGNTSVHLASQHGFRECLEVLMYYVNYSPSINSLNYDGFSPLHLAVMRQDDEIVRFLACQNAEVDIVDGTSGRTPLFLAVESGFEAIVGLLVAVGASVNHPNYGGLTPLAIATERGNKTITSMLISRGAMISVRDDC